MIINSKELEEVLGTFTEQEFACAVASARLLVATHVPSLSKSDHAVPTSELRRIYRRRSWSPRLREALSRQFEDLARIASLFPAESWHILIVAMDDKPEVTIFSNEDGVGRACLDFTTP
jgi:hypothetical protein